MDFEFSDSCRQIGIELRRGLERVCPVSEVRRCLETGSPSTLTWDFLAEMGVLGANVPERWGGTGIGVFAAAVCAQEVGRACAPVPTLSSVYLAADALVHAGSDTQRARWLPGLASGTSVGSYAFGSTGLRVEEGRVSGTLPIVPSGGTADFVIVDHGGSAILIALESSGVKRSALRAIDPGFPVAKIELDRASFEALEGPVSGVVDRAAVLLAFEQIGGADRVLDMARSYAMQRRVFGRNIGSFQAIKHKLADVWVKTEIARGHVYSGAAATVSTDGRLSLAAAAARVAASEAFEFAAQENIQVHGGFGFTWEADCHPYYKRSRSSALALGSPARWRRRLFEQLRTSKGSE